MSTLNGVIDNDIDKIRQASELLSKEFNRVSTSNTSTANLAISSNNSKSPVVECVTGSVVNNIDEFQNNFM